MEPMINKQLQKWEKNLPLIINPYGDEDASDEIIKIVLNVLNLT